MYTREEFEDLIDGMVPTAFQKTIEQDIYDGREKFTLTEAMNSIEKGRVFTIKEKISNSHRWHKATCMDTKTNMRVECFWCEKCNIRASAFDHISCLSIISKVRDNLPSYTVHNEYLMYTCEEIQIMKSKNQTDMQCTDCGIPEIGKTAKCHIIGAESPNA